MMGMPCFEIKKMLIIKKIKLLLFKINRKNLLTHVRLGYQSNYSFNKTNPALVDRKIIQWKEDITLPLYLHKTLEFQFYPKHDFGYNPEEIDNMAYGSAIIVNFDKKAYEGEVTDMTGQQIGKFSFQFTIMNEKRIQQNSSSKHLIFSSILAHLDYHRAEKGFIQFKLNSETIYTPEIKMIEGELLCVQKLILPIYTQDITQQTLIIKVYMDDEGVAEGQIELKKKKKAQKYKKTELIDLQTKQICGLVFVEFAYQQKKMARNESSLKLPKLDHTKKNSKSEASLRKDRDLTIRKKISYRKGEINIFKLGQYSYGPQVQH